MWSSINALTSSKVLQLLKSTSSFICPKFVYVIAFSDIAFTYLFVDNKFICSGVNIILLNFFTSVLLYVKRPVEVDFFYLSTSMDPFQTSLACFLAIKAYRTVLIITLYYVKIVVGGDSMTKILVVEDDLAISMGLKFLLEKEGYDLDLAGSVCEAKTKIDANNYDLYILDIGLPDGNGYDICSYIRTDRESPIIFLTARDGEEDVVKGLEIGGDDYISKPFRTAELVSRVKSVLRRFSTKISTNVMISGDIKIDQLSARAYLKGEEISLTPSEYKLLLLYMTNSKKVITRISSLEKLWDVEGDFINDASISVYIRRLREKIEDDPSNPKYLKTVRGIGYIWDVEVRRF